MWWKYSLLRRPPPKRHPPGTKTGCKCLLALWLVPAVLLLMAGSSFMHTARSNTVAIHREMFPGSLPGTRPPNEMKRVLGQTDLLHCAYEPPTYFDHPRLLHLLYGDRFDPKDKSGRGQIVVLGQHNSGTSIVTRLIMLLGAFQGNYETISISPSNKLKYYEQLPVSLFHDAFLTKFTDPHFRPYHVQSVNFSAMTQKDVDNFDCFARKQMLDLNRHPPWVMKDPRMGNTMHLWRRHMEPVCVFVYKDPSSNSVSLASNMKKSSPRGNSGLMSSQRWLDAWSVSIENSLQACRGRPTIVINSQNLLTDVHGSLQYLLAMLTRAGVKGLHMPGKEEIAVKVLRHIRKGPRVYKIRKDLNLTRDSLIDNRVPLLSPRQRVLDKALQFWMHKINGSVSSFDLNSGANRILQVMDEMLLEESFEKLRPQSS